MYDTLAAPFGGNFVTTKAAIGGFTAGISTYLAVNAQVYAINGKAYAKAAITASASPTTDINTGIAFVPVTANKGSVFVFALNAAGTVGVAQGSVETMESGAFINPPQFPRLPDTWTAFGYLVVKGASTVVGNWIFGVGLWDATGITVAAQDVLMLPARPQVA